MVGPVVMTFLYNKESTDCV